MGERAVEELVGRVAVACAVTRDRVRRPLAVVLTLAASVVPASAQECKFLCSPALLIEPTVTFEKDATVFETIFAVDLATPIPRVGVTLEAATTPFSDDNEVDLEAELNLEWLSSAQTRGWLSSHFDIIDQFSGAERSTDTRAYTHKLNFELDTAVAMFSRLPDTNWWHDVELEGSLDYLATGLPEGVSRWSFSIVLVLPIAKGR